MVTIEAEQYHAKKRNGAPRDFYRFPTSKSTPKPDPDGVHKSGAGNGQYLEILPDTRVTHNDKRRTNESSFKTGHDAPRLEYKVRIYNSGRYYVWGRAHSTGTEDNGIHVGVDGKWPSSGKAMQWCQGKHSWTWSSARRLDHNHCGNPRGLYLDLSAGEHTIMFGMREDGFELDRFMLVKSKSYKPSGTGPKESPRTGSKDSDKSDKDKKKDDGKSYEPPSDSKKSDKPKPKPKPKPSDDSKKSDKPKPKPKPSDGQKQKPGQNLVILEAENFKNNTQTKSHFWTEVSSPGSYSGQGAMKASPDKGANIRNNFTSKSPSLKFKVNFKRAGRHYIWVRAFAKNKGNSLHAGLNGKGQAGSREITLTKKGTWSWSNRAAKGRAYLQVGKAGVKTVDIWMREDGLVLDKIILTSNKSYRPKGMGPILGAVQAPNTQAPNNGVKELLVLEAESFDHQRNIQNHRWLACTAPIGYSGDGAMRAMPDAGKTFTDRIGRNSPAIAFNANFAQTGTYYVWLRGYANSKGKSAHMALNGQATPTARNITFTAMNRWSWTGDLMTGSPATLQVTRTGPQKIQVWMREDGLVLDKIILTTDPKYIPTQLGPQEGQR